MNVGDLITIISTHIENRYVHVHVESQQFQASVFSSISKNIRLYYQISPCLRAKLIAIITFYESYLLVETFYESYLLVESTYIAKASVSIDISNPLLVDEIFRIIDEVINNLAIK